MVWMVWATSTLKIHNNYIAYPKNLFLYIKTSSFSIANTSEVFNLQKNACNYGEMIKVCSHLLLGGNIGLLIEEQR